MKFDRRFWAALFGVALMLAVKVALNV